MGKLSEFWLRYKELFREDREGAEGFYREVLFPEVLELVTSTLNDELTYRGVDPGDIIYAICNVGMSWPPPALFIGAVSRISPQTEILAITSRSSSELLNKEVMEALKHCTLRLREITLEKPSDPGSMLKALKPLLENPGLKDKVVLVDVTAGLKPMAASLYGFAYLLRRRCGAYVYTVYTTGKQDRETGKVVPETQRIEVITDPAIFYEDILIQDGLRQARAGEYASAKETFNLLASAADATRKKILYLVLALVCEAEKALENHWYLEALKILNEVSRRIEMLGADAFREARTIGVELPQIPELTRALKSLVRLESLLRGNAKPFETLRKEAPETLMLLLSDFLVHGRLAMQREQYGLAALYYYRSIELGFQILLAVKGIDTVNPPWDDRQLADRFREEKARAVGQSQVELPERLALFDDYFMLKALGVKAVYETSFEELRNGAEARNTMILEHGFTRLHEKHGSLSKLEKLAFKIAKLVCEELCGDQLGKFLKQINRVISPVEIPCL